MWVLLLGCLKISIVVANSDGLHQISRLWNESLDLSIDPCEDLYQFACGNWIKNNPIPEDRAYYDKYSQLSDVVNRQTRAFYDSIDDRNSTAISKLKLFYTACMNTTGKSVEKTSELLEFIRKIGVWPMIDGDDKFNATEFDLTGYLARMASIRSMDVFFAAYGNIDLNNVSRTLIHFEKGSLGMSIPQFYLEPKRFRRQVSAYEQYMRTVIYLILKDTGISRSRAQINEHVKEIIGFEKTFAHVALESMSPNHNFSALMKARRLSDMDRIMSIVDWKRYFNTIMPEDVHPYIASNPEVIIANPKFFIALNKLLKRTPARTLANVMLWRFADAWWLQLDERFEEVRHDYIRRVIGTVNRAPRWKECSSVSGIAMAYASDALYVKENFDENDLSQVKNLFEEVRSEFMELLKASDWMDNSTRTYAISKAQDMIALVGAQTIAYNLTALDNYYSELNFSVDDTYGTMVRKHSLWKQKKAARDLLRPVDRYRLPMSATTVNAAYTFVKNALTIPSAILQPPFFDSKFPKATNYGAIGSIISHEIVHGFDMQGRQFDKVGNRKNWWGESTQTEFLNRTECMIKQYSAQKVDGTDMHIDGYGTQGENIADNGGIKQAFRAYTKYLKALGKEEARIPRFEQFDNKQMFFISYAMSYCGHAKPEESVRQIYTDSHAPSKYRINMVASNQPEFSDAFKCSPKATMNPESRCYVW
ncbi:unnamed protein product [Bursaphelenchus xylophilus]|uniref:(pine wood nematode) hypothetical protein n=1 Tax=Bursaphelenchus xylophilus TaxID=6326 RepID=A0A1I7SSC3_BURXY|nr:unnamed protein product [Bursaphelenchus xylophilus]CAG9097743.1 unnamed protein product [Bursaphelenchus xylophilus]